MSISYVDGFIDNDVLDVVISACDDNWNETFSENHVYNIEDLRSNTELRSHFLGLINTYYGGNGPHAHYDNTSYEFDAVIQELESL